MTLYKKQVNKTATDLKEKRLKIMEQNEARHCVQRKVKEWKNLKKGIIDRPKFSLKKKK